MSDAFTNALSAFSTVNNAFGMQRDRDRQDRLDAENTRRWEAENTVRNEDRAVKKRQQLDEQDSGVLSAAYIRTQNGEDPFVVAADPAYQDVFKRRNISSAFIDKYDAANVGKSAAIVGDIAKKLVAADPAGGKNNQVNVVADSDNPDDAPLLTHFSNVVFGPLGIDKKTDLRAATVHSYETQGADGQPQTVFGKVYINPATNRPEASQVISTHDGKIATTLKIQQVDEKGQPVLDADGSPVFLAPQPATANATSGGEDAVSMQGIGTLMNVAELKKIAAAYALQSSGDGVTSGIKGALVGIDKGFRDSELKRIETNKQEILKKAEALRLDQAEASNYFKVYAGITKAIAANPDDPQSAMSEYLQSNQQGIGFKGAKEAITQAYKDGVEARKARADEKKAGIDQQKADAADERNAILERKVLSGGGGGGSSSKSDLQTQKDAFANIKQRQADYDKRRAEYNNELAQAVGSNQRDAFPELRAKAEALESDRLTIREGMENYNKNYGKAFALQDAPQSQPKSGMQARPAAVVQPARQAGKTAAAAMYAVNPQTKQRIVSYDQGRSWRPAQ